MADGLNKCLSEATEWPPTAPKFRNLCLGIATDEKGREIASRAGIYKEFEPAVKQLPEPPEHKSKRKRAAESAIADLKAMFDEG